jgi:hypothetical protein
MKNTLGGQFYFFQASWTRVYRTRVPEPVWPSHHALRDSHHGREIRTKNIARRPFASCRCWRSRASAGT